jgi:hypothetical protein
MEDKNKEPTEEQILISQIEETIEWIKSGNHLAALELLEDMKKYLEAK